RWREGRATAGRDAAGASGSALIGPGGRAGGRSRRRARRGAAGQGRACGLQPQPAPPSVLAHADVALPPDLAGVAGVSTAPDFSVASPADERAGRTGSDSACRFGLSPFVE